MSKASNNCDLQLKTIFHTQKNQLRGLTKREYSVLRELCTYSRNLYNATLYNIRQHFFATGKQLSYNRNYHLLKDNANYKMLQAGVAQQTIKQAHEAFNSFWGLRRKAIKGEYDPDKVRIPHYLKQGEYFPLSLSTNALAVKSGALQLPVSNAYKLTHPGYRPIYFPLPERLTRLKEVRIRPLYNARYFEIEYVTEIAAEPAKSACDALSLDEGVNNLLAGVATTGASFLIDGRPLKAINQWYNKQNARLQSINDKQGLKGITHQMAAINLKRNHRVRDYLNKTARQIITFCLENHIGTIIYGHNNLIKQEVNIGRRNNQTFVQIPHWQLRRKLNNLCDRYGLVFKEQCESYTSKASFMDRDAIPDLDESKRGTHKFSGRRIKRGLYKSKSGALVNADLNAAANILVKSKHNFDFEKVSRGLLVSPLRIRVV